MKYLWQIDKSKFLMSDESKLHFNSLTIHGGQEPDAAYGAVMPPVYFTSTYAQSSPGQHKGYEYSRSANPTRTALERSLASIEGGAHGLAFASGLAAIDAVMKLLKPGDEIISTNDLYGGSYRIFKQQFEDFGLVFHFVPMSDLEAVREKINEKTKLLWVETPTNPLMRVIDIEGMAAIARQHDLLLAVDNTFATPYIQRPLELGADIVMHSATKYLAGHSDVVAGALVVRDSQLAEKLYFIQNASGAVLGPMDSFLTLRGIKTLHVRMQRHCENAAQIAQFLKSHSMVSEVYYPGFPDSAGYETARRQMKHFGGMISFIPAGRTFSLARKIVENLSVFTLAESLGGVESLAGHPASMTHASIPKEEREKNGLHDALIRLSVGIEDVVDLKSDLNRALSQ